MIERGDAGGVIAAVFEALERIDQMAGDRLAPDNSDDAAHPSGWPPTLEVLALTGAGNAYGNQNAFRHVTTTDRAQGRPGSLLRRFALLLAQAL